MPWKWFICEYCGHKFEAFRQFTGKQDDVLCPNCRTDKHVKELEWNRNPFYGPEEKK